MSRGASIALHYLSRLYWPDPADPIRHLRLVLAREVKLSRRDVPTVDGEESKNRRIEEGNDK